MALGNIRPDGNGLSVGVGNHASRCVRRVLELIRDHDPRAAFTERPGNQSPKPSRPTCDDDASIS